MMSKTLYIIRGLPGSGKSTLGEKLADSYMDYHPELGGTQHYSHAADDWFTDAQGNYNFDPEQLPQAHADCIERTAKAMAFGVENVAVCNTFSQRWEAEPYLTLAKKLDYQVVIIECQNNFGNIHDVPQQSIDNMKSRWEPLII